ncbi:hypothetical protein KKB83_03745 [Patescibacteria group bacterium]|nr:hypothetical protein [Patescibacteria group bacterium]
MTSKKEKLIQDLLQNVPETRKKTLEYKYRHLPHHLRQSRKSPKEIEAALDKIKFPQELR